MNELKRALLAEYGTFSDKRIKRLETGSRFIVDDRGRGDVGADGQLFSYFCMIFATVEAADRVAVSLSRNVPEGPSVTTWLQRHPLATMQRSSGGTAAALDLDVAPTSTADLRELAAAFRAITAPGARYSSPNYKYVCPRTADALSRLARVLDAHWSG